MNNSLFETIIEELATQNYCVVDVFFQNDILLGLKEQLFHLKQEDKLRLAGIGQNAQLDHIKTIRSDKIHWIDEKNNIETEKVFLDEIKNFSDYLNHTCYTGIKGCEFHYAIYETGSFYKRHLDQFKTDDSRKFSVITYLNENWQSGDGGELLLFDKENSITIEPTWGKTVFLKSDLVEHEVALSNKERLSVTGWLR